MLTDSQCNFECGMQRILGQYSTTLRMEKRSPRSHEVSRAIDALCYEGQRSRSLIVVLIEGITALLLKRMVEILLADIAALHQQFAKPNRLLIDARQRMFGNCEFE